MSTRYLFTLSLLTAFLMSLSLIANQSLAQTSNQCTMEDFTNAMGASESGGCQPDPYNCVTDVDGDGQRFVYGKYQFLESTYRGLGINVTPQEFMANPALQEQAFQLLIADNRRCLQNGGGLNYVGQTIGGVQITESCLLGSSHLGGCTGTLNWLRSGGGGPSDRFGTSLADYCGRFGGYGEGLSECGGGIPNAADIFGQSNQMIGCDPEILTMAEAAVDAFQEQQIETARAIISEPTSIEQMTCLDQQLQSMNEISDQGLGNPTGNIAQNIQQPFAQQMAALFAGGDIAGSINAIFNNFSSNLMNSFSSGLGGLMGGGGSGSTTCDATETAWLINQCIEMPQLPSLADIIGGQIGEIMGQIGNIASIIQSPERILEQVCSMANSALQDSFGNLSNAFEGAAENALSPVADRFEPLSNIGN